MRSARRPSRASCALLAFVLGAAAPAPAAGEAPLNPHTREGCIQCHKAPGGKGLGPQRTTIFPSQEEPHAVLMNSCRTCHKEGRDDFWLLVLPSGGERPSAAPSRPLAPLAPDLPPAAAPAGAAGLAAGEGFENSHDSMDCAGCHERPAEKIAKGDAAPPRFLAQGVDSFCRSCHSGVDRSHYPRGNAPAAAITCLNCHRVHGRTLLFPALRDEFPAFVAESADVNPHGGKIFCLACHPDTPQAGQPISFRGTGGATQLCRRCHSGVEHHPLGVKSSPATWKMDFSRFPLESEAITCATCHKPPECLGVVGRENPRFLRGGPYGSAAEFCARCHEGKKFSNLDPHDQLDESGEVYQKKCLYCHLAVPAANDPPQNLRYTDTLTALCISCHPIGPHPQVEHLLPLPRKMLQTLREFEERRQVRLPLDEGDAATCVTCHNPHERGLLKGAAGVGADEAKRLRLTTYNEQCTPCHQRH